MAINLKKFKDPKNKNILAEETKQSPKAKLTTYITILLTPEEKQKISDLANQKGFHKMSPFLRYILKKHGYI